VNVIALKTLRAFWRKHPEAETSLRVWHKLLTKTEPQNFHELKDSFNSADYSDPYTIFDIGGNNYRVIVIMVYLGRAAFIKKVFTHSEYTKWNAQRKKGNT
jgi:mRNA interferase HigB